MLKVLVLCLGAASAFVAPASMQQQSRTSAVSMMARNPFQSSGGKPKPKKGARPLSPGSNYPTTKNIQTQRNGFGTFVQKFQLASGKSKYGVPIFLPNGNVNPAYLAAEREEAVRACGLRAQEDRRRRLRQGLLPVGTLST